jgi:hypothetical protein
LVNAGEQKALPGIFSFAAVMFAPDAVYQMDE